MEIILPEDESNALNRYLSNPELRVQAYQKLYENPTILFKIRQWMSDYTLKGREAEDVLQDAMILLDELLSAGEFRGASSLTTFFLGICKNIIRAGARRANKITFKDALTDADWDTPDEVADHLILQEDTQAEALRKETLLEKLKELTEKCQEALQKYYFESLNMKQIAAIRLKNKGEEGPVTEEQLAAEAKQAKKTVHRCRENLRDLMYPRL